MRQKWVKEFTDCLVVQILSFPQEQKELSILQNYLLKLDSCKKIHQNDQLYHASPQDIIDVIQGIDEQVETYVI